MKVIQLSNTDIMQFWNVLEPAISKALATSEGEANTY